MLVYLLACILSHTIMEENPFCLVGPQDGSKVDHNWNQIDDGFLCPIQISEWFITVRYRDSHEIQSPTKEHGKHFILLKNIAHAFVSRWAEQINQHTWGFYSKIIGTCLLLFFCILTFGILSEWISLAVEWNRWQFFVCGV